MINQNGNSILSGMLIFLMISFIGLKVLNFKLKKIEDARYLTNQYLCMKEYNGETRKYVKYMQTLNSVIELAKNIEYISYLFPVLRPLILIAQNAGRGVRYVQEAFHFSYLKNYLDWSRKSCYFDPRFFKNPYKINYYGLLKRDAISDKAIMRSKKWSQILYAPKQKFIIKSDLELSGFSSTNIKTQEYALPKKIKFQKFTFKDIKEAMRQVLF